MEIKYQIFKKEKLLIQKFIGTFSVEKYVQYNHHITAEISLNSVDQVLIDFRDVFFNEIPDDFEDKIELITQVRKNINKNIVKRDDVKVVFWVDKPIHSVIAHMFIQSFSNMNYTYCYTIEGVLDNIKISEHYGNIEKIARNLENTFDIIKT